MGGGSPSTWPAAKPNPPSLAGAYSTNLETAFLSLVNYSDWLSSHPNPNLVKNYASPTSNIYQAQVYLMQQLEKRQWREASNPTEIDFLKVITRTSSRQELSGRTTPGTRSADRAGMIYVLISQKREPYLEGSGRVVGYSAGGGPTAWAVSLGRGNRYGQFVIDKYQQINITGGFAQWEKELEKQR